tara:strand:+ start:158 stop:343 length:186 start_codon:yes stop_codon:yes gene_type:complete
MGNCIDLNNKVTPKNDDELYSIGSVHTITRLSDLKLDFMDTIPDKYEVKCVDFLRKGEVSV